MAAPVEPQVQITVKKWNCVAVWNWNTQSDQCGICRNSLTEPCMNCQADSGDSLKCTVSFGQCNHAFHTHCIEQWLRKQATCPVDASQWQTAEVRQI